MITVRKYAFLQLRLDSDVISYSNLSFFPAKTRPLESGTIAVKLEANVLEDPSRVERVVY